MTWQTHVRIEEITGAGLSLSERVPVDFLAEALAEGASGGNFRPRAPAVLAAHLSRIGHGVLLTGQLTAELAAPCKRCLAEVPLVVPAAFTLNLMPASELPGVPAQPEDDEHGPRAGTFDLADADDESFDGKTIQLDPIVREQVLLALPISVVCKETCKGLCSVCGQNLNDAECGCDRRVLDPRLAALKDIKL